MSYETGKVYTFTWEIENYSLNNLKGGKVLDSPVFYIEHLEGSEWFLRLYPKGCLKKSFQGFVACFLFRSDTDESKNNITISFKLEIMDSQDTVLTFSEHKEIAIIKGGSCRNNELLAIEKLNEYIKNSKKDILKIRCHIFSQNYQQQVSLSEVRSQILTPNCAFRWMVNIPDCAVCSKIIKFKTHGAKFLAKLTVDKGKIHFKISSLEKLVLNKLYKLEVAILNNKGASISMETPTYFFESTNENYFLRFETYVEIKKVTEKLNLLHLQSLTLMCIMSFPTDDLVSLFESYSFGKTVETISQNSQRSSLQEDLKNLLWNEKHCDVKLQAQGNIVPAHKYLLCARSPVFSAMFDKDMLENQTGIVDIPDVESEILRYFLEFLYTDTITNTESVQVLKLIIVADKYQVKILKEKCADVLMSKLSTENICDVVSVADMINQLNLKHSAGEYIKINKRQILLSPNWTKWVKKNMELAIEILSKLSLD